MPELTVLVPGPVEWLIYFQRNLFWFQGSKATDVAEQPYFCKYRKTSACYVHCETSSLQKTYKYDDTEEDGQL